MKGKMMFTAAIFSIANILSVSVEKRRAISPLEGRTTPEGVTTSIEVQDTFNLYQLDDKPAPEIAPPAALEYEKVSVDYSHVTAVAVVDGRAVAGTEGGLFFYDPQDSTIELISAVDGLRDYRVTALTADGHELYIGTQAGLYRRNEIGQIMPLAPEVDDRINAIALRGEEVFVGTENYGLVKIADGSSEPIFDKFPIADVRVIGNTIWAAVYGDGLYSFDGNSWKKRYLDSDNTAFDYVSALGYDFNRLFAGTPDGLWVFDGGQWKLYDTSDGLFDCDITTISFKGWKILAGTRAWGHFEIFEDVVTPMYGTDAISVTSIASDGRLVVVGTDNDGIFVQSGKEVHRVNPGPGEIEIPVFASLFM